MGLRLRAFVECTDVPSPSMGSLKCRFELPLNFDCTRAYNNVTEIKSSTSTDHTILCGHIKIFLLHLVKPTFYGKENGITDESDSY